MSRTPLMGLVRRTLGDLRAHEASGSAMPLDEFVATRRSFLRLAGVGGAALLGSGCRTPTQARRPAGAMSERPRPVSPSFLARPTPVAIVGAGLAGLHCAYRLSKVGAAATVFEGAKRTGGRVFTDRVSFGDLHCELGGELIDSRHQAMLALAKELGVELLDDESEKEFRNPLAFVDGRLLTEADTLRILGPFSLRLTEMLSSLKNPKLLPSARNPNGAEKLDRLSMAEWFEKSGLSQTDPAWRLLESAYVSEFGLDLSEQSAVNVMASFLRDAPGSHQGTDGSYSDRRFHAKGGSDTFVRRIMEKLELWQLRYEHRLVAIEQRSDGQWTLTFDRDGQTIESTHEHVVIAVPFSVLREVEFRTALPEQKQRAIDELGYGHTTKIITGYSERIWRTVHHFSGTFSTDLPMQTVWDSSRLQPGTAGLLAAAPGGRRAIEAAAGSAFDAGAKCVEQLARIFPSMKRAHNGRVARMAWSAAPFAKGSFSVYKLGQYTTLRGFEAEAVGNLHFAGEHTADVPGSMNSAVESGARAAREVAVALGITKAA